jgi:catechol 2,3-dioxygenase-like lactoylglutathione lyase family enzyme
VGVNDVPVGRLHHVVLDCPDPRVLAGFWSAVLGEPVTYDSDDWVVVAASDRTSGLAFQRAPDHRPPVWGDPDRPQQWHVDVMVDDKPSARTAVEKLGAVRLSPPDDEADVYADPAGHPFCLIARPGWAPPVNR